MITWVVSPNLTERALIVAALAESGFESAGFGSIEDLNNALADGPIPDALVLDAGTRDLNQDSLRAAKISAPHALTILVAGSDHLSVPADHILQRPLTIGELTAKIRGLTSDGR